jgi:hypothetical protein
VLDNDPALQKRIKHLRKLKDVDGLHGLVGDTIFLFVKSKRAPFPQAMLSQKHFLQYATWKMAFIFVKLVRELTCLHANKHWNKFGYSNYKLNKICFRVFCDKANEIWSSSPLYNKLPETWDPPSKNSSQTTPIKRRTRSRFELSSPEAGKCSVKRARIVCLISDSEDSEDEDEDATEA